MNNYEITHTITKKGLLELVWLCFTSHSIGYGSVSIGSYEVDYQDAKKRLQAQNAQPCVEDIWVEILRSGKNLKMYDHEEEETTRFNLEGLMANFAKVDAWRLSQVINEEDDACTHDEILQCLLLGDVVYC